MGKKIVIAVDVQHDFVYGSLANQEAQNAMRDIIDRLMQVGENDTVIFTRDTHDENYMNTQEGKNLPVPHCLIGTSGWQIADYVDDIVLSDQRIYINKSIFGSYILLDTIDTILTDDTPVDEIEMFGFCTDICVISNALMIKSAFPELKVKVNAACCAGVTPAKHEAALEVMRSCQIEII